MMPPQIRRIRRRIRNYFGANAVVNAVNPNAHEKQNRDTIKAVVEDGSLVIPLKHVDIVKDYMRRKGIPIDERNMPIRHSDAIDVILVRGELTISPRWVPEIVRFLKSQNIYLPGMK